MRSKLMCFLIVTLLGLASTRDARAQSTPAASSAPRSGARAEFLEEVSYYEARYTRLAETVPADKYNWRPAEGVRSIGEVFAHVAAANYGIARAFALQPPPGMDVKAIGAAAGDKAKTVESQVADLRAKIAAKPLTADCSKRARVDNLLQQGAPFNRRQENAPVDVRELG